jgi:branched-chain amino acid transport system substrate-binding protein
MLPYTGTFAPLGVAITNGFKLAVEERGGKLGGREIEYIVVDDESNPAKAPENANKLVQRDKVDVVIGTVHSGVAMGMAKVLQANPARCGSTPTPAPARSPARCARPTFSAPRSPTGRPPMPSARCSRPRATRTPSSSPGSTPPARR